jgi:signal transduction histidine kinase
MGVHRITPAEADLIPEEISGGESVAVLGNDVTADGSPGESQAVTVRKSDVVPRGADSPLRDIRPMRTALSDSVSVFVHEVNQQLAVATMTESALSKVAERAIASGDAVNPEQVKSLLEPLRYSLDTITDLVRELRGNTRKRVENASMVVEGMKSINISDYLGSLVHGWHQLFDDQARISSDIDPDMVVIANKRALHEILHNVFMNAVEICEKKGGSHPEIFVRGRVFRDLVQIIIQDNGPGITVDEKLKLLTPGFTTKGGHGIGIIRCDQLIHGMNGSWDLLNNAERDDLADDEHSKTGASFVVEFPLLRV